MRRDGTGPRRRFEVEICISGDTWDDIRWSLDDALIQIAERGPECASVTGGVHSSYCIGVVEDPSQTHERYVEQLDEHLDELRKVSKP